MRSSNDPFAMTPRRSGFTDIALGLLGGGVIRIVLGAARLWARLTRSPWQD